MKITVIYPGRFEEPQVFEFPIGKYSNDTLVYNTEYITNILDLVFRQCNHVDDTEWIKDKKLRSMSVGDMILIENDLHSKDLFVCCDVGWKEVSELVKEPEPWP